MKLADILGRSGRSLRTAKTRTILTSLAIAVGAFTLTLTLAAGNGIRAYTDRLVATNFDPAESIVGRDKEIENNGPYSATPKEYDESVANIAVGAGGSIQIEQVTDKDVEELRKLPFVEQVRPNYQLNARYLTREGQKRYTVSVQAYNPGQKPELVAGNLPRAGDLNGGEVILPDAYLGLLGFATPAAALNQQVILNVARPFNTSALSELLTQFQQGAVTAPEDVPNKTVQFTIKGVSKRPATSIMVTGLPMLLSDTEIGRAHV